MRRIVVVVLMIVVACVPSFCLAGLGKPLPVGSMEQTNGVLDKARSILKEKGYDDQRIEAVIAKLGPERLSLISRDIQQARAGGDPLDFILFVFVVGLIVLLVIFLLEEERRGYYRGY